MSKKKTGYSQSDEKEMEETKKNSSSEFRSMLIIIYFLAAFGITAYATEHNVLTYGQIAVVYLPMFFIFIHWQRQRMQEANNGHTRVGSIVAIGMCMLIIVVTTCITISAWLNLI